MGKAKKFGIFVFVIALGIFGFSQYASASQIGVEITQSELVEKKDDESRYNVELKFENPSFLVLTAGETEFFVIANDDIIGKGKLEPFILPSLGNSFVKGSFTTNYNSDSEAPIVKITGITKYDIIITSIEVPFVYYPTEEQASEFIQ
ncbi:hypothetical protein NsoK4_09655 [Nitrosopumilus sp. K4]|uniref:hypothetical protein n=1 Tax=Nitrosopumilus sp. K4 TaxID=2795383 RepID=UPI001BABA2FE|nr:hypothetical protein [Nitrosopumilus sp. K4]QUC64662.1 hypothetical protein NsoK4_09655 [Nitrosopumilus sp. K4]